MKQILINKDYSLICHTFKEEARELLLKNQKIYVFNLQDSEVL